MGAGEFLQKRILAIRKGHMKEQEAINSFIIYLTNNTEHLSTLQGIQQTEINNVHSLFFRVFTPVEELVNDLEVTIHFD